MSTETWLKCGSWEKDPRPIPPVPLPQLPGRQWGPGSVCELGLHRQAELVSKACHRLAAPVLARAIGNAVLSSGLWTFTETLEGCSQCVGGARDWGFWGRLCQPLTVKFLEAKSHGNNAASLQTHERGFWSSALKQPKIEFKGPKVLIKLKERKTFFHCNFRVHSSSVVGVCKDSLQTSSLTQHLSPVTSKAFPGSKLPCVLGMFLTHKRGQE